MSKELTEEQQEVWKRLNSPPKWNGNLFFDYGKALENPMVGSLYLDTSTGKAYMHDGTEWQEVS